MKSIFYKTIILGACQPYEKGQFSAKNNGVNNSVTFVALSRSNLWEGGRVRKSYPLADTLEDIHKYPDWAKVYKSS